MDIAWSSKCVIRMVDVPEIIHFERSQGDWSDKPEFYCDFSKHDEDRMTTDVRKVTCRKCIYMINRDELE